MELLIQSISSSSASPRDLLFQRRNWGWLPRYMEGVLHHYDYATGHELVGVAAGPDKAKAGMREWSRLGSACPACRTTPSRCGR